MRRFFFNQLLRYLIFIFTLNAFASDINERFVELSKESKFELIGKIECKFTSYHPQGLLKIGDDYYLSSVQILKERKKYDRPDEHGHDRSAGNGIGHLFKIDARGRLIKELTFVEGNSYHPSGIDGAGGYIWLSVAEYRPESCSTIFKVDTAFTQCEKAFTVRDHIGGLVYNKDKDLLYGFSWGSRRIYCWTSAGVELYRYSNPSHFIDYQDAKYIGDGCMLASGLNKFMVSPAKPQDLWELGGLAMIELATAKIVHEIPLLLRSDTGVIMTRNPMDVQLSDSSLRFYFAPEDNQTIIYIYQVRF